MALGFMDITRSCNDTDTSDMQRISLNGNTLQEHVQRCESDAISTALFEYQWNRTKTAKALGIDRRTLFAKIRKYGLEIESEN